jgi:hypothetical protein
MRTALATIDFFAFVVIAPNTRFRVSTFQSFKEDCANLPHIETLKHSIIRTSFPGRAEIRFAPRPGRSL